MNPSVKRAAVALWVGTCGALARESALPPRVEPELEPDTNLLAKIAALPDNTWLKLPPVKTAGDLYVYRGKQTGKQGE